MRIIRALYNREMIGWLTETYGPDTECLWHDGFNHLQGDDRAEIKARTGVAMPFMDGVTVMDPDTMTPVALVAVVAKPDEKWGEVPCACIEMKDGQDVSKADPIAFCRERLAGFKTPKRVIVLDLPRTSAGKIQKFELRAQVRDL